MKQTMALTDNPPTQAHVQGACTRCRGLLVREWCMDLLDDTGRIAFEAQRCVLCGHLVDALILRNRRHPLAPRRPRMRRNKVVRLNRLRQAA